MVEVAKSVQHIILVFSGHLGGGGTGRCHQIAQGEKGNPKCHMAFFQKKCAFKNSLKN